MGRFLLRVLVGGLFVGHGTQKLFGWFGGDGLEGTAGGFESMGMRPGKRHAAAAGAAEAGGGLLLTLGLATPLAAAAVIGVMLTAIRKVHLPNGVWVTEGGFEYNAVLMAAVTFLAESGPGPLSLDRALGTEKKGVGWGLAALTGGALASTAALSRAAQADPGDLAERLSDEAAKATAGIGLG